VDLLVSSDTARVGEQVDVVTAAWFPAISVFAPPAADAAAAVIDGVWTTPGDLRGHRRHPEHGGRW
jgi:hypothetical protein